MRGLQRRFAGWLVVAGMGLVFAGVAQAQRNLSIAPAAEKRVALVIGNNDYRSVTKLERAVSDARTVGAELRRLGFEVLQHANLDRRGMNQAVGELVGKVAGGGVGLLFFAGHGVQVSGSNFLLPVDIRVAGADDLQDEAIDLGRVMERLSQARAKFTLMIIDACRDNPFPRAAGRSVGGARGLSIPSAPQGLMVVYSAGVNEQALDKLDNADRNPNGLFTREFVKQLRTPGVRVDDMVRRVRNSVREQALSVGHVQNPAIYDQSNGDFFFTMPAGGPQVAALASAPPVSAPDTSLEVAFWNTIKDTKNPAELKAYLEQYPGGEFTALAKTRMAALEQAQVATLAPAVSARPDDAANDRAFWDSIKDTRDPAELKAYLSRYPQGIFASLATARARSLDAASARAAAPAEHLTGSWTGSGPSRSLRIEGSGRDFRAYSGSVLRFQGTVVGNSITARYLFPRDQYCVNTTSSVTITCNNIPSQLNATGELSEDGNTLRLRYESPNLKFDVTSTLFTASGVWREQSRDQVVETLVRQGPQVAAVNPGAAISKPTLQRVELRFQPSEASRLYEEAVRLRAEKRYEDSSRAMIESYSRGYGPARAGLGWYYRTGVGAWQNDPEFEAWCRQAAAAGSAMALFLIGYAHERGEGAALDPVQARQIFEKASNAGHAPSTFHLGRLYSYGLGVDIDFRRARSLHTRAAEAGYTPSMISLGILAASGYGVTADAGQFPAWGQKAADGGNLDGTAVVGLAYLNGWGMPRDLARGISLLQRAADGDSSLGLWGLGVALRSGNGIAADVERAVQLFRRAAEQRHYGSMTELGFAHESGQGLPRDPQAALQLFRAGSDGGDARGMRSVANALYNGAGIARDVEAARLLLRKASLLGDPEAKGNLQRWFNE